MAERISSARAGFVDDSKRRPCPGRNMTATARQLAVLRSIHYSVTHRRYPPTLMELCASFGWASTNAAAWHVERRCSSCGAAFYGGWCPWCNSSCEAPA